MRSNPLIYINPNSITILPNQNESANDLAVYISLGTTIKLYSQHIPVLGYVNGGYQEWALVGRNRRLMQGDGQYTIYARLSKTDKTNGYLIFAKDTAQGSGWNEKYPPNVAGALNESIHEDNTYWYVKLGTVSAITDGQRTVTLDTGILGTDQYNTEWQINPDDLPMRIELDAVITPPLPDSPYAAGNTPYVPWSNTLQITAHLIQGWETAVQANHWGITRQTKRSSADAEWNAQTHGSFASTGIITLQHQVGGPDDFSGCVSSAFAITAYDAQNNALASIDFSVMAEVIASYKLELSSNIMTYDPGTASYDPADGIIIRIKATAQDNTVEHMFRADIEAAGLHLYYENADGTGTPTELSFSGGTANPATATLPTTAFSSQQNILLRLIRELGDDSSSSNDGSSEEEDTELDTATVAFLRNGEDSKLREWIFFRNTTASWGTDPAQIAYGEVNPEGIASDHIKYNKRIDGWVPSGWTNHPQGVTGEAPYEYSSYRDFIQDEESSSSSSDEGGSWGAFTQPTLWSHYGERGTDGDGVEYVFARTKDDTPPTVTDSTTSYGGKTYKDDGYLPEVSGAWTMSGTEPVQNTRATNQPQGVNNKLPYEWVAMRTMGSPSGGIREWQPYPTGTGSMSMWSRYSKDGETPYVADLDNEMDGVNCDDTGLANSEQTLTTNVNLYQGHTKIPFTVVVYKDDACTQAYTKGTKTDGVTVDWTYADSNKECAITFKFWGGQAQIDGNKHFYIKLSSVSPSGFVRVLCFTAMGQMGKVYNVNPDHKQIVFAVDATTNEYTPTTFNITTDVMRRDEDGTETEIQGYLKNIDSRGYKLFYRWLNKDGNQSDADGDTTGTKSTHWYNGWGGSTPYAPVTVGIPSNTTLSAIEYAISTAADGDHVTDTNIIDRERIPITKSGKKGPQGDPGDDAITATASTTAIMIECYDNGKPYADGVSSISFGLLKADGTTANDAVVSSVDGVATADANTETEDGVTWSYYTKNNIKIRWNADRGFDANLAQVKRYANYAIISRTFQIGVTSAALGITRYITIGINANKRGVSITNERTWYKLSSQATGVTVPSGWTPSDSGTSGGWSTTEPTPTISTPYAWRFTCVEYSDGSHTETTPYLYNAYGAPMPEITEWLNNDPPIGKWFYKGDNGEPRIDIVKYNGDYFRCDQTFQLENAAQINTRYPHSPSQYWSKPSHYATFLYADLIVANAVAAKSGSFDYLKAKDVTIEGHSKIGGFTYNIQNEVQSSLLANTFNPFGVNDLTNNFYALGYTTVSYDASEHRVKVVKFPDCGSSILNKLAEDAELVLPFYDPTLYTGAGCVRNMHAFVPKQGDGDVEDITDYEALVELYDDPYDVARRYLGSRIIIDNFVWSGNTLIHPIGIYGAIGFGPVYKYNAGEYDRAADKNVSPTTYAAGYPSLGTGQTGSYMDKYYVIIEHTPFGRGCIEWHINFSRDSWAQSSVTRDEFINAIKTAKQLAYVARVGMHYNYPTSGTPTCYKLELGGITYYMTATPHGNTGSTEDDAFPFYAPSGTSLLCVMSGGRVMWEIEDAP